MTSVPPPPPGPNFNNNFFNSFFQQNNQANQFILNRIQVAFNNFTQTTNTFGRTVSQMKKAASGPRPQFENRLLSFDVQRRAITVILSLINDLDELQKKAVKNGLDLQTAFEDSIPKLSEIPGGLRKNLMEAFEFFEAGYKKPTESMIKLSAHLRSVGGDTEKLRATLIEANATSRVNIDKLSAIILDSSKTYQITADNIVKAISQLSDRFLEFDVISIGDQVTEAMSRMAQLGPQYSGHLANVIKTLTQAGTEGAANVARLGLLAERTTLMSAKTASEVVKAVTSSVNKLSSMTKAFTTGGDPLIGLGAAYNIFGEEIVKSTTILSRKIGELTNISGELTKNVGYANVLANFGLQLFDPIVNAFVNLIPYITGFVNHWIVKLIGQFIATTSIISLGINSIKTIFGLLLRFTAPFRTFSFILGGALLGVMQMFGMSIDIEKESLALQKKQDAREETVSSYAMEMANKNARISEEIKQLVEEAREKELMQKLVLILEKVDNKLEQINSSTRDTANKLPNSPIRGGR